MSKKVFLCSTSNHCENNIYLGTRVFNYLKENNIVISKTAADADVVIINTCAFSNPEEEEAARIIDFYRNKYPGKKDIIICGCFPGINTKYNNQPGIYSIGPKELEKFDEYFKTQNKKIQNIKANKLNRGFCPEDYGFPDHYYIQISQGCINNCSYCAIKKAKGNVTSKPVADIISELEEGLKLGNNKFVLLADDCGSYGYDIGIDFALLLNELNKSDQDFKLNIHYIHPSRLLDLYPKISSDVFKNRIYFMNIPVQSASQRILSLMNRNYDINKVLALISEIRSLSADIYIDTHIIYGFPSETRREFTDIMQLTDYFDRTILFQYSEKKDTASTGYSETRLSGQEISYRTVFLKGLVSPKIIMDDDHFRLLDKIKSLSVIFFNFTPNCTDSSFPYLSAVSRAFECGYNIYVYKEEKDKDPAAAAEEFSQKFSVLFFAAILDSEEKTEKVNKLITGIKNTPVAILDYDNYFNDKNTDNNLTILNEEDFIKYLKERKPAENRN